MYTQGRTAGEAQARDYLNRVYRTERKLRWKREQIVALREMATSATMRISDMPRGDSPNLQRMEALVCKITDLEQEVLAEAAALEVARIDTALMICNLQNEQHQQLLTERYLRSRGWKDIADAMGYSLSHMFRLHEDALCHMEALLAKEGARP
ncbi:MAG: hypothetical protein VB067_03120 [Christensenellaceae bacterium]|nr:hypothetical protein [Christensenellaceae bacterium]MEA5066149.1 hypothetical protein [Eubacteriales bacterium]MEA5067955.1 hypothetical protein [Christensenellaceae bacterium]